MKLITKTYMTLVAMALSAFVTVSPVFADGEPYSPYSPYSPHVPVDTSLNIDGFILFGIVAYLIGTGIFIFNSGLKKLVK